MRLGDWIAWLMFAASVACVWLLACEEGAVQVLPTQIPERAFVVEVPEKAIVVTIEEGAIAASMPAIDVPEHLVAFDPGAITVNVETPAVPAGAVSVAPTLSLNGKTPWVIGGAAVLICLLLITRPIWQWSVWKKLGFS